ncbi:hypothetical protein [Streptosporangium saharense]|uniref:CDP-Glycerol:Poly(Glycerophosphate) glycerophosphotransferase n=1 Tax=Streptosporangium saharense TaxID=1706840 RepID=A0A7W7QSB7_9ACTN|nr:hypothetical protein [Streptosporangium saharense]MBB4918890.1 hypothetical protein [Streptosporangium saharense]
MSDREWNRVTIGLDAHRWVTRRDCKTILAVVHTVTSGQRLLDTIRLIESDLRVQVVFTMAPDVFNNGVEQFIEGLGGVVIPWLQATQQRFDLALSASLGSIHEIHAPLVVMPHGAGFNKLVPARNGAKAEDRAPYGLDAQRLMRDGVVLPTAITLPHEAEVKRLARTCPQALPVAEVVGDSSYDRLVASLPHRDTYRQALRVDPGQKLVVVTSTWGPQSLFGKHASLLPRLLAELPREEFRVVALFHPNIWFVHGIWQVRAWLAGHLRDGLTLIPPDDDWRAVLAAADWIIGDHGSVTLYGAATGKPVMLAGFPHADVDPASALARLAAVTPRISQRGSLRDQLDRTAKKMRPGHYRSVIEQITSEPGRFDHNMRCLMYRLMKLQQPERVLVIPPVPAPSLAT